MNTSNKTKIVLGLMSETSMDGIDTTTILSDGIDIYKYYPHYSFKYSKVTQKNLFRSFNEISYFLKDKDAQEELTYGVTIDHYKATEKMINKTNIIPELIGFHGQTIYHNAKKRMSLQLGDATLLAKLLKIDVVSNFRKNDIINGGEGAPLAPIYHKLLIKKYKLQLPSCIINIGGISNLTYYDGRNLIGFDTGPGNGLMDQLIQSISNEKFDEKGKIASKGIINKKLIDIFKNNKYFKKNYPKSLDRHDFSKIYELIVSENMSIENKMATLSELTIQSIIISMNMLPQSPKNILISGGGANNIHLIKRLKSVFKQPISLSHEIGISTQRIEADLIAFLAIRCLKKYPITFPKTTGARKPTIGGDLFKYKKL